MNKLLLPTVIVALTASTSLWAKDPYQGKSKWAKVTEVEPITRSVQRSIPREECWTEQVRYEEPIDEPRSYTGTILGGIIGGALGNAVGHKKKNKQIGTAVGAVLGATVGHDISNRGYSSPRSRVNYRNERRCETYHETHYEEEVIGYDVWYRYKGDEYQTRMNHRPGNKIKVRVNVEPY